MHFTEQEYEERQAKYNQNFIVDDDQDKGGEIWEYEDETVVKTQFAKK